MGLFYFVSKWFNRDRRTGRACAGGNSDTTRRCVFETMEPRQLLTVAALDVGAVYIEEDFGTDAHGDTFEITFQGGAEGTELTRLEIHGDQGTPGFNVGDVFFDTQESGLGADHAAPFQLIAFETSNPAATFQVFATDGSPSLVLEFNGFTSGDKIRFSIDVDEVEYWDPAETDLDIINEGFDPITSGVEFQGTTLTAQFTAPHFHDIEIATIFRNRYDAELIASGLDLPEDNVDGKRDRTAAAIGNGMQQPLPVEISGTVFLDSDLNLVQSNQEFGLPNVRMELWRLQNDVYVFTGLATATDANGEYRFSSELNLQPGTYQVRQSQPANLFSVGAILGTVDGRSVGQLDIADPNRITAIEISNGGARAAGYDFAEAAPAAISGYVYHDRDNDGIRSPGEEGIGGVAVRIEPIDVIASQAPVVVTTGSDGSYQASGMAPGRYRVVQLEQPAGFLDGLDRAGTVNGQERGLANNPGDAIAQILLHGGDFGLEYNFGELQPATIGGRVQLADEDGRCFEEATIQRPLADVAVDLLDANGNLVSRTSTDANGEYRFSGLPPGRYTIVEHTPPGLLDGGERVGGVGDEIRGVVVGDDTIGEIMVHSGETADGYDFCEYLPAGISGFVYHDRDNDGVREDGEEGLADVNLVLLDQAGHQLAEKTTDATGRYSFDAWPAGTYAVVQQQPDDWVDGLDTVGQIAGSTVGRATNPGDRIDGITIRFGQHGVNYNFGELKHSTIEGSVYLTDADGDCFGSASSLRPLSGTTVWLEDEFGATIATTTTDQAGHYRFAELLPGRYAVIAVTPDGLIDGGEHLGTIDGVSAGEVLGNDTIGNILLSSGQSAIDFNFCEHEPASLSGYVYHDADNDGVFDDGESPIAGVEVSLQDDDNNTVAATTTDANGFYEFRGLSAGRYTIVETQPSGFLDGRDSVGQVDQVTVGSAINPGDRIEGVALRWGDAGRNYNFGELRSGSIEGFVHTDLDNDCVFDDHESPIAGVTIQLLDTEGGVISTTETDAGGFYRFENLPPGEYAVRQIQPAGYFHGGQRAGELSGDDSLDDIIAAIAVGSGQRLTDYNFCEQPPSSISGYVYADLDGDCVLDADEAPIAEVMIELLDANGAVVAATRTNVDGFYQFVNLPRGVYSIRQTQPDGFFDGSQRAGSAGGDDANANLIGGIHIEAGMDLHGYDFCETPPGSLWGHVFVDANRNVTFDEGETPIRGVSMRLLDSRGNVLAETQTGTDGGYHFANLPPGEYAISQQQPSGYFSGGQSAASGGDVRVENLIARITLGAGRDQPNCDFAELLPGRISGYVFQDGPEIETDDGQPPADIRSVRDGLRTPDDTPLAGVQLELRDGVSGDPIGAQVALPGLYEGDQIRTVTDENGYYEFRGLPRGNYSVYQIHPDGYVDSLDTPGTTSGIAINPSDDINPLILQRLSTDPGNDAIILIPLPFGGVSEDNNFSEIVVRRKPTFLPPQEPPIALPSIEVVTPPPTLAPVFTPPLFAAPPPARLSLGIVGGGGIDFTWHLSVIDGGLPRGDFRALPVEGLVWRTALALDETQWNRRALNEGRWLTRLNTDSEADSSLGQQEHRFGTRGGIPIVGDFNGDGIAELGIFDRGHWFLDINGNGVWDDEDLWAKLGNEFDRPVVGDWNGDGKDDIGIHGPAWEGDPRAINHEPGLPDLSNKPKPNRKPKNMPPNSEEATSGRRLLKSTIDGKIRADVIDHVFHFGASVDKPVTGDWTGDGIRTVGTFRDGLWKIDIDGDGHWSDGDEVVQFGQAGDLPVVGDFNGDGVDEIGVFRRGLWIIDINGNRKIDAHDKVFELGGEGDYPVVGDFDGDGIDDPGVYRDAA